MATEAQKAAKKRYKKKVSKLTLELYPTDTDIKDYLDAVVAAGETKQGFIKRLIREDLQRGRV